MFFDLWDILFSPDALSGAGAAPALEEAAPATAPVQDKDAADPPPIQAEA